MLWWVTLVVSAAWRRQVAREDAASAALEAAYPEAELGLRVRLGREAQGLAPGAVVRSTDPRLELTYGEFSIDGVRRCLEAAGLEEKEVRFADIGSGTGRIAAFAALRNPRWECRGYEISETLHAEALRRSAEIPNVRFERRDVLLDPPDLSDVDVVFAYATAFPAPEWSPDLGAPLLDNRWTRMLQVALRDNSRKCRVMITDRALDPAAGFVLDEVLDVPNRETAGSLVFIHTRED
ncbi:hypothetical protein CTAYLR_009647 [Chrysophaeum taylorii]|uniref:Methyltransferase domain-containing protein n=1 Tax=Chrysophaeum taylorii TaxID=2483200 RepID=A0AAD7XI26_9STRA|nr:hypothetical protein CTAYLR_009647 [Chrysophaeum taylorii]